MDRKQLLQDAIQSGETENGFVEFKESLSVEYHTEGKTRNSLAAQMRHRIISGDGLAQYVIGIADNGTITGLPEDKFDETVSVLKTLSNDVDATLSSIDKWTVDADSDTYIGLIEVQDNNQLGTQTDTHTDEQLIVGTAGHVDHGKSTLVGSLVTGEMDNGDGKMRNYLDVQPHEIERGLSADLSFAVYGFTQNGEPIHLKDPNRNADRANVVDNADRIVSFVDTVGHKPWLRTAIRGLVGQQIDYAFLVVDAQDGPTEITKEHLGVLLAMDLPTIITLTKTDTVSEKRLTEVHTEIEELLYTVDCHPLSGERHTVDTLIDNIDASTLPVIETSAVTGEGLDTLQQLLQQLPTQNTSDPTNPFRMYIDKTYTVKGVGTVISGSILDGSVEQGDTLYLGPFRDGSIKETTARSLEMHYQSVTSAQSGNLISIALSNVSEDDIERGMLLSDVQYQPTREFTAEIMLLNHKTSVSEGYEPTIHLETISGPIQIYPDEKALYPGDKGLATIKFRQQPYIIEPGQRFIFREGSSRGVGVIKSLV